MSHSSTEIAVIADTHMPRGDRSLSDSCLEQLRNADLVMHAGDLSGFDFLEQLRSLTPRLVAVHGNVDDRRVRAALPERVTVDVGTVRIGMVHDAGPARGRLARLRRAFPDVDAVVFGHSHMPLLESEGGFAIFNPGSPTERRRAPRRTLGIAEVNGRRIDFRHVYA